MNNDKSVIVSEDLLEDMRDAFDPEQHRVPDRDFTGELDRLLEPNGLRNVDDHYFEEFESMERRVLDEISNLEHVLYVIGEISDAATEIDCDWGGANVEYTFENDELQITVTATTNKPCDPIDRLYELESDVENLTTNVRYGDCDSGYRYLRWTFDYTVDCQ